MRRPSLAAIISLAALTLLFFSKVVAAQQVAAVGAPNAWAAAVKDTRRVDGLFTFYQRRDNTLLMSVVPSQLDHEFGMMQQTARGPGDVTEGGATATFGDGVALIRLHRIGDRVELQRVNTRFTAGVGSTLRAGVESNVANSALELFKIEATDSATGAVLLNVTPFFASDYPNFLAWIKDVYNGKPVSFDREHSYVDGVRATSSTDEIDAELRYRANEVTRNDANTVSDKRFIPIRLRTSLFALPSEPMRPRLADDRVGYFVEAQWDYDRIYTSPYRNVIDRFRLEPGERVGDKYRPKKQIVFWIDRTVPRELRPYVKQGVLAWNRAFEAAGWIDVMATREMPEADSTESNLDLDRNVIRWSPIYDRASAWADGGSDPRTGEVLRAEVNVQSASRARNVYATWIEDAPSAPKPGPRDDDQSCEFAEQMSAAMADLRLILIARGELAPDAPLPAELEGEVTRKTIMHEVGHTLGLRHNFKASSGVPYDSLADTAYVRRHGVTNSVMGYPPLIIRRDGPPQSHFWPIDIGDYDVWAIRYGYSRIDDQSNASAGVWTPERERAGLEAIAREGMRPEHAYGTDGDAAFNGPWWAVDPTANGGVLGDDPIRYARDRIMMLRQVLPELDRRILRDSIGYDELRTVISNQVGERAGLLNTVAKYIGGSYVSRSHFNDPGAPAPFTLVTATKQREALAFVLREGFAPEAFAVPARLLNEMLPSRIDNWGATHFPAPLDFPIQTRVLTAQRNVLQNLLHPARLQRMFDAESRVTTSSDAYLVSEMLHTVTRSIWSEVLTGPPRKPIDPFRRNAQSLYVAELSRLVLDSPTWPFEMPNGTTRQDHAPTHARALARLELVELDGRIARALDGTVDRDTLAHLAAARESIRQTLSSVVTQPR
jgi:hypothetical protein